MDLFNKKKVALLESKIALRENERDSYKRQLNEMMQEYKMLNLSIEAFLKNVYEGKYLKYLVAVSYTPSEQFLDYSYIKCIEIKVKAPGPGCAYDWALRAAMGEVNYCEVDEITVFNEEGRDVTNDEEVYLGYDKDWLEKQAELAEYERIADTNPYIFKEDEV